MKLPDNASHDLGERSISNRSRGFTLIELLVVLFIISIITATALLSIRFNENKQIETIAREINARLTFAEEQAILLPGILGLKFDGRTFQFMQYVSIEDNKTKKKKSIWQPISLRGLTSFTLPDGVSVKIKLAQAESNDDDAKDDKEKNPAITISTNGDITPFKIELGKSGKKPLYSVIGLDNGTITTKALY